MADEQRVTVQSLAEFFGVGKRRVQQLADEGLIPKDQRGEYPFLSSVQGYIKCLQNSAGNSSQEANREKIGLIKAQRQKIELELAEKSGQFLLAEDVEYAMESMITAARTEFMAGPRKLKKLIKKEYGIDVDLKFLQTPFFGSLDRLARYSPDDETDDDESDEEMASTGTD